MYGFGMLLLEAVTVSPAAGAPGLDGNGQYLAVKVLPLMAASEVAGLMDGRLDDDHCAVEVGNIARIKVDRVMAQPGLWPAMAQVRAALAEKAARSISVTDDVDMMVSAPAAYRTTHFNAIASRSPSARGRLPGYCFDLGEVFKRWGRTRA